MKLKPPKEIKMSHDETQSDSEHVTNYQHALKTLRTLCEGAEPVIRFQAACELIRIHEESKKSSSLRT